MTSKELKEMMEVECAAGRGDNEILLRLFGKKHTVISSQLDEENNKFILIANPKIETKGEVEND